MKMFRLPGLVAVIPLLATMLLLTTAKGQVIKLDTALKAHISEAIGNNPDLRADSAAVNAARQKVSQAGAWADPMLKLSLMNIPVESFDMRQEPMTGIWTTLNQSVPITGKFGAKRKIAESGVRKSSGVFLSGKTGLARDVAKVWYEWAYLRASVTTVEKTLGLLEQLLEITRTRYETGRGLQQDVFRVETERLRTMDRLLLLKQKEASAGRRFAVLLGRQPTMVPDPPGGLDTNWTSLPLEELENALLFGNPALITSRAATDMARNEVQLARKLWWPDLKLSMGYGYRGENLNGANRADFLTVGAGFTLPIFGTSKQGARVEEVKARLNKAEAQQENLVLRLKQALEDALDEDSRLSRQIDLYTDGVIPQAEATLSAALSSYSVGKVDIEALLAAETALLNTRLERWSRVRDRSTLRASLAALLGGDGLLPESDEASKNASDNR